MAKRRKNATPEFKARVVKRYLAWPKGENAKMGVAKMYRIGMSTVARYVTEAGVHRTDSNRRKAAAPGAGKGTAPGADRTTEWAWAKTATVPTRMGLTLDNLADYTHPSAPSAQRGDARKAQESQAAIIEGLKRVITAKNAEIIGLLGRATKAEDKCFELEYRLWMDARRPWWKRLFRKETA